MVNFKKTIIGLMILIFGVILMYPPIILGNQTNQTFIPENVTIGENTVPGITIGGGIALFGLIILIWGLKSMM